MDLQTRTVTAGKSSYAEDARKPNKCAKFYSKTAHGPFNCSGLIQGVKKKKKQTLIL